MNDVNKLKELILKIITVMMSDRKKYNYNVGSSVLGYTRNTNTPMTPRNQNTSPIDSHPYNKKIGDLEIANKKLVDETARQFQKFEADIMRVEGILEQKQKRVQELQKDSAQAKEDQGTLIEALKQKEEIIQQLQIKLKQIIQKTQCTRISNVIQEESEQKQTKSVEIQTDQVQKSQNQQKWQNTKRRNIQLEEELCKLKEELFSANSELALVQQEFSTYKVLNEIEMVKNSNEQI